MIVPKLISDHFIILRNRLRVSDRTQLPNVTPVSLIFVGAVVPSWCTCENISFHVNRKRRESASGDVSPRVET
jgi:hypothetical protein